MAPRETRSGARSNAEPNQRRCAADGHEQDTDATKCATKSVAGGTEILND
jgi:hypothetical protein